MRFRIVNWQDDDPNKARPRSVAEYEIDGKSSTWSKYDQLLEKHDIKIKVCMPKVLTR